MKSNRLSPIAIRALSLPQVMARANEVALWLAHQGREVQSITIQAGRLPTIQITPTPRLCAQAERGDGATWVVFGCGGGHRYRIGQLDHPEAVIRFKQILEAT